MRFTVLGSGSAGNCSLVESGSVRLLIDAGFSGAQIKARLAPLGLRLEDIDAVLLTHEHGDHTAGLPALCGRLNKPLYCNRATAAEIRETLPAFTNWHFFPTGQSFAVGDLTVDTFPVPHDAAEPVGFVVHAGEQRLGFLTDLGHTTHLVIERVRHCQTLVLEANYDLALLQADVKRPWSIKQRIMGRHGHLSNSDAASVVDDILSAGLTRLYLGHLSADCNRPELAAATVNATLARAGASHVHVEVTSQTTPTERVDLAPAPAHS
jgi:phosphoribosyl 1,2-cyclic phosphodiesterase